jgi:hypothetical protein
VAFCTKCGCELQDSALFCPKCGTPVGQPNIKQETVSSSGSSVVFKYEKNILFMMLTEPLEVTLDGGLNLKVIDGREVCYNVTPGSHTFTAYVPYLMGSKYGAVTKTFYVGNNETMEVTYSPPAAIFMSGNVRIKRIK